MIIKYPRTYHLPTSPGLQNDDKRIETLEYILQEEVIITEKLDGENTNIYNGYIHARSPSFIAKHPSRNRIMQLYERINKDIPEDWRICGENCYAKHSIHYKNLEDYFFVFSVWNKETCFSWEDTLEVCSMLNLVPVKELYRGKLTEEVIEQLAASIDPETQEGFVIRPLRSFTLDEFPKVCAKWVRKGHIQTTSHWMYEPVVPNTLRTLYGCRQS